MAGLSSQLVWPDIISWLTGSCKVAEGAAYGALPSMGVDLMRLLILVVGRRIYLSSW